MKFLEVNTQEGEQVVKNAITKYGYAPEHNFHWYLYSGNEHKSPRISGKEREENIFVYFNEGFGLLTRKGEGDVYSVFAEPLAPPEYRGAVLKEYIEYILVHLYAKKVVLELQSETRNSLLAILPEIFHARRPAYSLTCPMVNINTFDLNLSGKRDKDIRYTRNKFIRRYNTEFRDAKEVENAHLHAIVEQWRRSRKARDRTVYEKYHNLITSDFQGVERARACIVDGRAVAFTAGWPIPNSSSYYLGVILHDYSLPSLGVMLYLETLGWLKSTNYVYLDLGGGEKMLTQFKNQFHPEWWYNTHVFSIVKK